MSPSFAGKVALVTGAAGGIGLATARAFAQAGAAVVLADRDASRIAEAAAVLCAAGHRASAIECDVTDAAAVERLLGRSIETYGRLDAAFNNAALNCASATFLDTEDATFERIIDVNLRGVWYCMRAELRRMRAQGGGAIVNCASVGGLKGSKGRSAYSASKHAVIGLTRSAAIDHAADGIRINAVCPGIVDTPMLDVVAPGRDPAVRRQMAAQSPLGRLGEAAEIAAAVLWLCGPDASFVQGHAMVVDGGLTAG